MRRVIIALHNFADSPKIISNGSKWNGFKAAETFLHHVQLL
jgi:hypothetical protein